MMAEDKYSVLLEKVGDQPLMSMKILCCELGLGLAAAKGTVDKAPTVLANDLDGAKALDLKRKLEEVGNTVSVPGLEISPLSSAKSDGANSEISYDEAFAAIFGKKIYE